MVERYRDRNVRAVRVKPCGVDVRHVAGQMAYGRSHTVQGRHGHSQQGSGIHWAYQIRKLISHGGPYAADRPKARERRRVGQAIMRIQNLQVSRKHRHLILGNQELYASSRMLEKLASVFGEVGRVGITEIRDGWGNNPHTVFLSHFQWREDFTQSKPLGAVSTNWNAPELAEYAIPRMNNTLLLHGHTHAYDPLEFGRHHNEINVGLDAWCFEPVNEAELVDNWLHTALNVTE